jgi:hypothetical protein
VHRLGHELIIAAVIQFSLNPVVLFLFVQPSLWQRRSTERTAPSLQQVDHYQSVIALPALDS